MKGLKRERILFEYFCIFPEVCFDYSDPVAGGLLK